MGQLTERTTHEVMNFIEDRVHNMSDAERKDIYAKIAISCSEHVRSISESKEAPNGGR